MILSKKIAIETIDYLDKKIAKFKTKYDELVFVYEPIPESYPLSYNKNCLFFDTAPKYRIEEDILSDYDFSLLMRENYGQSQSKRTEIGHAIVAIYLKFSDDFNCVREALDKYYQGKELPESVRIGIDRVAKEFAIKIDGGSELDILRLKNLLFSETENLEMKLQKPFKIN